MSKVGVSVGNEFIFWRVQHTKAGGRLSSINVPVSYNAVRRDFLRVVSKVGLDPSRLGLHFLRSGGASQAAK